MDNEVWKFIDGAKNAYMVSDLGNVKSLNMLIYNSGSGGTYIKKGKILKLCIAKNGYVVVNIFGKTNYVHRLVCTAFIGNIGFKMTINHKDGNKQNNKINNLEIVSYSDNHIHAFKVLKRKPTCSGRFGSNHNCSKPIIQKSLDGKIIGEFQNAREATRLKGFNYKKISACCTNNEKTHKGFMWEFKLK